MKKEYYEKIIEELIKLIDEGVYIVDKQGVGRFYNDTMATMEKVNVGDVLQKKFHEAFPEVRNNDSTMLKALLKAEPTVKKQQTYKNFYLLSLVHFVAIILLHILFSFLCTSLSFCIYYNIVRAICQ